MRSLTDRGVALNGEHYEKDYIPSFYPLDYAIAVYIEHSTFEFEPIEMKE